METLKRLLAALFILVLTGFFGWWFGQDLWADFQHRAAQFEPVRDARITEAKCKSKLFVIAFCDIKATGASLAGGRAEFSYFMLGGAGDDPIGLQRVTGPGAATTRYVTTTYGIEHFWSRVISFAVLMGVLLAVIGAGVVAFVRGNKA
jgi:hypothetical protein